MNDQKKADEAELATVIHRNIHALLEVRKRYEEGKTTEERFSDRVTRFFGSTRFVLLECLLISSWCAWNGGFLHGTPFDPYPFQLLATLTSTSALFISVFVLISQNRNAKINERRADLDLQIGLLSEHEITKMIHMLEALMKHQGVPLPKNTSLQELKNDVQPEVVMEHIEAAEDAIEKK